MFSAEQTSVCELDLSNQKHLESRIKLTFNNKNNVLFIAPFKDTLILTNNTNIQIYNQCTTT